MLILFLCIIVTLVQCPFRTCLFRMANCLIYSIAAFSFSRLYSLKKIFKSFTVNSMDAIPPSTTVGVAIGEWWFGRERSSNESCSSRQFHTWMLHLLVLPATYLPEIDQIHSSHAKDRQMAIPRFIYKEMTNCDPPFLPYYKHGC